MDIKESNVNVPEKYIDNSKKRKKFDKILFVIAVIILLSFFIYEIVNYSFNQDILYNLYKQYTIAYERFSESKHGGY